MNSSMHFILAVVKEVLLLNDSLNGVLCSVKIHLWGTHVNPHKEETLSQSLVGVNRFSLSDLSLTVLPSNALLTKNKTNHPWT